MNPLRSGLGTNSVLMAALLLSPWLSVATLAQNDAPVAGGDRPRADPADNAAMPLEFDPQSFFEMDLSLISHFRKIKSCSLLVF